MGVGMDGLANTDGVNQLAYFCPRAVGFRPTVLSFRVRRRSRRPGLLDPTCNWSEFQQDSTGSGTWDLDQPRTHNAVNEITAFGDTSGPQSPFAGLRPGRQHDRCYRSPTCPTTGFTCTYDAWNRLVLVVDAASGAVVAQYQYDARGFCAVSQSFAAGVLVELAYFYYSDRWQVLRGACLREGLADRQFVWGLRYIDDLLLRDRDTTGGGTLDERLFCAARPQLERHGPFGPDRHSGRALRLLGLRPAGLPRRFLFRNYLVLVPRYPLYCGYRWDAIVGSYSVRNRVLWPHLGRWDRRDPIGFRAGKNRYCYVSDRPLRLVDPYGTQFVEEASELAAEAGPELEWLADEAMAGGAAFD